MIEATGQPDENELLSVERPISFSVERRGVQNEGGFLTPYYLFDLMGRKHADELDPVGRAAHYQPLKRAFFAAQKKITEVAGAPISFEKTWSAWYKELFQTLGFISPQFRRIEEPVETAHHGMVPISHGYYSDIPDDPAPLIFIDLHPFGTNLDRGHYLNPGRSHELTTEPISRALELALDQNETRWVLFSNGIELRLYRRGSSVARQYLKVDFATLFANEDPIDWLVFWGVFRLAAFVQSGVGERDSADSFAEKSPRCLLDTVIYESQQHATKIADDLRENLVRATEQLLQGVVDTPANYPFWKGTFQGKPVPDEDQLKSLFDESVYFLFRLLFVLYAESRDLLPIGESEIYRDVYSVEHLQKMSEQILREEDFEKT